MEIFIENQLKNIGYSIILGLIFGAFYDIICIIHIMLGVVSDSGDKAVRRDLSARILFFLTDLIFMLCVTAMMSVFVYEFADGDFRMYLPASAAAGFVICRLTLGRMVSAVSEAAVRLIRRVFRVLVIGPLKWIAGILGRICRKLWGLTAGALLKLIRERVGLAELNRARKRLNREIRMESIINVRK